MLCSKLRELTNWQLLAQPFLPWGQLLADIPLGGGSRLGVIC